jgi:arylsulfatase I/J
MILVSGLGLKQLFTQQQPPNLLGLIGWAGVGYHREFYNATTPEVVTPNIDKLVANGIELDRHYAFKSCSPSRCALQRSARIAEHANLLKTSRLQREVACPR